MSETSLRRRQAASPPYNDDKPIMSRGRSPLFSAKSRDTGAGSSADGSSNDSGSQKDLEIKPVNAFVRFWRSISGLWKTTIIEELEQEDDEEIYTACLLREFATYIPFLVCLCIMGFCMLTDDMFYLTKAIQGLFVDTPELTEIKTTTQFWDYMEGAFLQALHKETYYDGSDVHHTEIGYVLFENKILGRPRLRQIRVNNKSCQIAPPFSGYIGNCYGQYSPDIEEKITYWSGEVHSGWAYQSAEELQSNSVPGKIGTYGGGGFVQELADTQQLSTAIVGHLKKKLWVDRGTRAVFVDFTLYNANVNLFSLVKLIFEFPPTGGVSSMYRFQAQKLLRYVTPMDYFVMACEGIILLYVVYYMIEEIQEAYIQRSEYFKHIWSYLDCGLICLAGACVIMNIYRTLTVNKQLESILKNRESYGNFELLSTVQDQFNDLVACTLFVAWYKVFKYLGFNHTMAELKGTLKACMMDILAFTVMFVIVFFAFAISGVIAFGTMLEDFKNFSMANFTLFRILLGDFDFDAMAGAAPTMGPIYFLLYIFAFVFLLLNMFMAIFFDTYAEVKEELDEIEDKFDITEYMSKGVDKVKLKLALQQAKIEDIRYALKEADVNNDNEIDLEEWRAIMKLRGHSTTEAEAVFAKYDKDGDGVLNKKEQYKVIKELDEEEADLNEEEETLEAVDSQQKMLLSKIYLRNEDADESESEDDDDDKDGDDDDGGSSASDDSERNIEYPEFNVVKDRVEQCEDKVKDAISKMDDVLGKLEEIDRAKRDRRETMDDLIRQITEFTKPNGTPFPWFTQEDVTSSKLSTKSRTSSQPGPSSVNVDGTATKDTMV